MTVQVSSMLDQLVHRLVKQLQPKLIYLFGSQARGDALPQSDYDLLVVVPESSLPRHQRETKAYDALWGLSYPAKLIVLTTAEFEQAQQVVTSLASTVLREGILLYG
jgi:predicted nucleotidyltransferase